MTELPEDVRDLAALDLYGAQVQDWSIAGDSFSWTLLAGDTHAGHELATVTYVGAVVLHTNRRDLDRAVAAAAEVERSTVAPTEDSGFEHRIPSRPATRSSSASGASRFAGCRHPTTCGGSVEPGRATRHTPSVVCRVVRYRRRIAARGAMVGPWRSHR